MSIKKSFIIFDVIGFLHCYLHKITELKQNYDLFNKCSSIVIEEARTIFSFFKCILEKTKGAKKELKRSKIKEGKGSKLVMLDISAACFFMSLNVEKISTGLNKSSFVFSVLVSLIYT